MTTEILFSPTGRFAYSELEEGSDEDSADELRIEFTAKSIDKAREAYENHEYARVIKFLKLAQPRFYRRIPKPVREDTIRGILAKSLFEVGRISEARMLCGQLLECKITDDQDRIFVLEMAYLLAQVHLFEGALADASTRCHQAMTGHKRLNPVGDAYLSTVALMVAICRAQGADSSSEVYDAMLPAAFLRPSFKIDSQPAGSQPAGSQPAGSRSRIDSVNASVASIGSINTPPLDESPRFLADAPQIGKQMSVQDIEQHISYAMEALNHKGPPHSSDLSHFLMGVARNDHCVLDDAIDLRESEKRFGWTALHIAVICAHKSMAVALLDRGASIDSIDRSNDYTPLLLAVRLGYVAMVGVFINRGACSSGLNAQALHRAVDPETPESFAIIKRYYSMTMSLQALQGRRNLYSHMLYLLVT